MFDGGATRELSAEHVKWLEEERRIPAAIARKLGVFSMGDAIAFPMCDAHGVERYVKCRKAREKGFFRTPQGTGTIPWGLSDLAEAIGIGDDETLVWVEGEPDKLSAHVAGEMNVISVPDGAKANKASDVAPVDDTTYEWLWDENGKLLPAIDKFKRHILAVDNDEKGRILAADLAVRLGRARCYFVNWPPGTKDLNDVLRHYGPDKVAEVLDMAKPLVPSRLAKFGDVPRNPNPTTYSTGWSGLDDHLRLKFPELCVVVGPPGAGKSQWTLALVANMARVHNMSAAIVQFEDDIDRNRDDLIRYAQAWRETSDNGVAIGCEPEQWVDDHFVTLAPNESDDDPNLLWLRETIFEAVRRHGCRIVLLDPWNALEHMAERNETETLYTRRALRAIKKWARQLQCIIIIVTHPTKSAGAEKRSIDDWSLYDVEGSGSWNAKADHGVVVWRENPEADETFIKIAKSKDYRRMGFPGTAIMAFEPRSSLFKFLRKHST